MYLKKTIFILLLLLLVLGLESFNPEEPYRYPMDDHYALAGTFGELRNNHFHSGIDIKTLGKTGIPVHAIQDGWLFRLKVSPYGFGNAVYLRHADGKYSVYAHLRDFSDKIEPMLREEQQKSQSWEQEIYPDSGAIEFKKGEIIAFSGNSGSSSGPHLHFEIRDSAERTLNSLRYFRTLVKDKTPPILRRIAFEPVDIDSRVNGYFTKKIIQPSGERGKYTVRDTVFLEGRVGLEYRAFDLLDAAYNHCGINHTRLYLDENLIHAFDLDRFSFDESHYINTHIDYSYFVKKNRRLQKTWRDGDNRLSSYRSLGYSGLIELNDHDPHIFKLELEDTHGNISQVTGVLKKQKRTESTFKITASKSPPSATWKIKRDNIVVEVAHPTAAYIEGIKWISTLGDHYIQSPDYQKGSSLVYLIPLDRNDYPQQIMDTDGQLLCETRLKDQILPDSKQLLNYGDMQLLFAPGDMYAPMHLMLSKEQGPAESLSDVYIIGNENTPVRNNFILSISKNIINQTKHIYFAKQNGKGKWKYAGGKRGEDGKLSSRQGEFGRFCLMLDSIPPTVTALNFQHNSSFSSKNTQLRLKLTDDFGGIRSKSIFATLDGNWVPFAYDYKRDRITHRFKNRLSKGTHTLEVHVKDGPGNEAVELYKLKVY